MDTTGRSADTLDEQVVQRFSCNVGALQVHGQVDRILGIRMAVAGTREIFAPAGVCVRLAHHVAL
jgi:hypothetical protein